MKKVYETYNTKKTDKDFYIEDIKAILLSEQSKQNCGIDESCVKDDIAPANLYWKERTLSTTGRNILGIITFINYSRQSGLEIVAMPNKLGYGVVSQKNTGSRQGISSV